MRLRGIIVGGSVVLAVAAVAAVTTVSGQGVQSNLAKAARLRNPAGLNETAPAVYKARFDTTKGAFVIQVTRDWAPVGADRFYNLVKSGFFDDVRFFRVVPGFMVQFGLNGNPAVSSAWRSATLRDDPVKKSNARGYVTFAKSSAPNSRTTQVFISFGDNRRLDATGFAPFGQVVEGMEIVDRINAQYREQPDQGQINSQGNAYLEREFPKLDYIKSATIVN